MPQNPSSVAAPVFNNAAFDANVQNIQNKGLAIEKAKLEDNQKSLMELKKLNDVSLKYAERDREMILNKKQELFRESANLWADHDGRPPQMEVAKIQAKWDQLKNTALQTVADEKLYAKNVDFLAKGIADGTISDPAGYREALAKSEENNPGERFFDTSQWVKPEDIDYIKDLKTLTDGKTKVTREEDGFTVTKTEFDFDGTQDNIITYLGTQRGKQALEQSKLSQEEFIKKGLNLIAGQGENVDSKKAIKNSYWDPINNRWVSRPSNSKSLEFGEGPVTLGEKEYPSAAFSVFTTPVSMNINGIPSRIGKVAVVDKVSEEGAVLREGTGYSKAGDIYSAADAEIDKDLATTPRKNKSVVIEMEQTDPYTKLKEIKVVELTKEMQVAILSKLKGTEKKEFEEKILSAQQQIEDPVAAAKAEYLEYLKSKNK